MRNRLVCMRIKTRERMDFFASKKEIPASPYSAGWRAKTALGDSASESKRCLRPPGRSSTVEILDPKSHDHGGTTDSADTPPTGAVPADGTAE